MEPDIDIGDEGYSSSISPSYATTLASDILTGVTDSGRKFASYGKHHNFLPIDEPEMVRNDIQHCKFLALYEGRLHLSPLVEPRNILDLGTGNATWAIEMADQCPSANVLGVDVAAIQPQWVPPNLQFEILDLAETDWMLKKSTYDLIHARELIMAVRDWPALISQSFDYLKPGGYLELACNVPDIQCDDGTLPPGTMFPRLSELYFETNKVLGMDGRAPERWKAQLIERGFEDVQETIFKIPTNTWPKDKRMKQIGALELMNTLEISGAGMQRAYKILGWDGTHLPVLLTQMKKELQDRSMHTYIPFYTVFGKKPKTAGEG